ncbi:MAG: response regulator, partial [Selenomonadaceae bacterium]|nr:response regulator [Selenomonadaceae bacterium]
LRESDDQNVIEYSENIRTAGNMLLGLINDILDFSKIEAGKLEILPVEYDISSLLKDLVSMVQLRAESKGLDLSVDFDGRLPSCLYGDGVRIKQIITNILTNAVKYTEKGSVTFSVGFERSEERPDIVILFVSVKDTGIGIKKEDIGKLFSKFERIEEKCNRHVEGTGLGMAITQNLLGMMGTSLHVESEYGRGSNFYFRLVQKVVRWEPMGDYKASSHGLLKEHKAYREKFTAPDACVLVVDDNPMNLMVFRNLLKKTRVQIDMANSGDEGLLLAQGKKYDIIFLDHMMPRKDGIETLHELRAQVGGPNIDTPAVCLTANAISGARERYIAAGFHEYLTKPVDFGKLEDMLMTFLPEEKIQVAGEADAPAEVPEEIPEVLAPLKEEDWIDLNLGMENNGDAKSYLELLQIFYESMDEKAEEIEGFYAAENLKDYTIKVHALKSSARIIGAKDFGEEAQKLENAGKRGDMGYIRAHHAAFLETYRSFRAPLAGIFASSKTEKEAAEREKPEADEKRMEGVYEEIRAAADEMDCERLDAVFSEMEGYRIPEREAELYEKLKDAASKFEYDTILDLLPKA